MLTTESIPPLSSPHPLYRKIKCRPSPPSSGIHLQSKLTTFPAKSPAPPRLGVERGITLTGALLF
jgi:hypothetical protein